MPGWLVTTDGGKGSGEQLVRWTEKQDHEIEEDDIDDLPNDLKDALKSPVTSIFQSETMSLCCDFERNIV